MPDQPDTVATWFKKWTTVAKEARTFVIALVALVAAVAALGTAIKYAITIGREINAARAQTKAGVTNLSENVDTLATQTQQNYENITLIRSWVLDLQQGNEACRIPPPPALVVTTPGVAPKATFVAPKATPDAGMPMASAPPIEYYPLPPMSHAMPGTSSPNYPPTTSSAMSPLDIGPKPEKVSTKRARDAVKD